MHGAAGGLGTLALQMLTTWGAKITAIARPPTMAGCLAAGAIEVLDGTKQPFASLGRAFDATLNFATWDDDLALVRCLRGGAPALSELASLIEQQRLSLPIAIREPLDQADEAFEHIRKGRPGQAILTP